MPSDLGTEFPQGLVVLSGVGSGRRTGVISSSLHEIGLVSAGAMNMVKSDLRQNSSDTLSSPSQTAVGMTQGLNYSANATIYLVGPATIYSCEFITNAA